MTTIQKPSFISRHPFIASLIKRYLNVSVAWVAGILSLVGTVTVLAFIFVPDDMDQGGSYSYTYGDGMNDLLSIPVRGTIMGSVEDTAGIFASEEETSGYDVKEQLYTAADDDTIHGVILEINSPGGTIYGSRAIADGVQYYKEQTGNPVYAYVEGMAASGGYWAAASTDKIISDYGSEVGSIGVIMGPFQYYDRVVAEDGGLLYGGVVTQNGITNTMVTAGTSKDIGNPYRRLTNAELASLQASVNNEYDSFVAYVSKQRKIPEVTLRNTIGAMPYDNQTAQTHKLIDQTASRDQAYDALAKAAGVEDDYAVMRKEYIPSFVESLLMATIRKPQAQVKADTCAITRSMLVYHGDVSALCKSSSDK